jgi:serine/threonine protein kinase
MDTFDGFDSQTRITDLSKLQQPHMETRDLVTIRRPRDYDNCRLEIHHNGYCPVHIGDLLKNGTYKILHRLGNGIHAVVWLAENLRTKPRFVAIKIFSRHCSEREINSEILKIFNSAIVISLYPSDVKEGLHHLVKTLDQFTIPGPTNEHVCTVMELVGPCLRDSYVVGLGEPLPRLDCLALASQLAKALLSLHYLDIVHGGLYYQEYHIYRSITDLLRFTTQQHCTSFPIRH